MKEVYSIMFRDMDKDRVLPTLTKAHFRWIRAICLCNGYPSRKDLLVSYFLVKGQPNPCDNYKGESYTIFDGDDAVCRRSGLAREEADTKIRQDIREYIEKF